MSRYRGTVLICRVESAWSLPFSVAPWLRGSVALVVPDVLWVLGGLMFTGGRVR